MNAIFRTALVSTMLLVGCAATSDVEDDTESSEDALSAPCELGNTCPASFKLLTAKSFPNGPTGNFRSDVQIEQTEFPKTPRVVRQATSRPFTQDSGVGLALRGATAGASWKVDNILLVEVLDASSGERLDAAFAGYVKGAAVTLGGAALRRIGAEQFEHAAGTINLASLLPKDRAFRLRVSALDNGVDAYVTDVYADVTAPEAPPVIAATPRSQSTLRGSSTPLAKDFTTALNDSARVQQQLRPLYSYLRYGFVLPANVHELFGNETKALEFPGIAEVDAARIFGILDIWWVKLPALRARVQAEHAASLISDRTLAKKLEVLAQLQRMNDVQMTNLARTFQLYPEVSKVILDW